MSINNYTYNDNNYKVDYKIIYPSFYDLSKKIITEKNWVFCEYNNNLHIIHSWYPIKICKIINNTLKLIEEKKNIPSFFINARGSTNGINYNNEIWFILHKAQNYIKNNDYYFNYQHFFCVFDKNMNFLRHSELFKFDNYKVEFCLSFLFKNNNIYIAYSGLDTICKLSIYNIDYINNNILWYNN